MSEELGGEILQNSEGVGARPGTIELDAVIPLLTLLCLDQFTLSG